MIATRYPCSTGYTRRKDRQVQTHSNATKCHSSSKNESRSAATGGSHRGNERQAGSSQVVADIANPQKSTGMLALNSSARTIPPMDGLRGSDGNLRKKVSPNAQTSMGGLLVDPTAKATLYEIEDRYASILAIAQRDNRRPDKTPVYYQGGGNTKPPKYEVGVHWIQGSIRSERLEYLRNYLVRELGEEPIHKTVGHNGYERQYHFQTSGVTVNFDVSDHKHAQHGGRLCLTIPGKACDTFTEKHLQVLLHDLMRTYKFKCTRIDIFFDDFTRLVTPAEIFDYIHDGNISGFQKFQNRSKYKRRNGKTEYESQDVALGTRGSNGSGKFMRIYDKSLETNGERNCIRYEFELSGHRSIQVYDMLIEAIQNQTFAETLTNICLGDALVKFVDRRSSKDQRRVSRMEDLPFWNTFKTECQAHTPDLRKDVKLGNIDQTETYLATQVAPSYSKLRLVDYIEEQRHQDNRIQGRIDSFQEYAATIMLNEKHLSQVAMHCNITVRQARQFYDQMQKESRYDHIPI